MGESKPTIAELRQRREQLEKRLNDGLEVINRANERGRDVAAWEAFWLSLLREYEQVTKQMTEGKTL